MNTKHISLDFLVPNEYNIIQLETLVRAIVEAQDRTSMAHFGWIADSAAHDGIITNYGIVSAQDFLVRPMFIYELADLYQKISTMKGFLDSSQPIDRPQHGAIVMAIITTEFFKRGDIGTVEPFTDEASWPERVIVRWGHGQVSMANLEHVKPVKLA